MAPYQAIETTRKSDFPATIDLLTAPEWYRQEAQKKCADNDLTTSGSANASSLYLALLIEPLARSPVVIVFLLRWADPPLRVRASCRFVGLAQTCCGGIQCVAPSLVRLASRALHQGLKRHRSGDMSASSLERWRQARRRNLPPNCDVAGAVRHDEISVFLPVLFGFTRVSTQFGLLFGPRFWRL